MNGSWRFLRNSLFFLALGCQVALAQTPTNGLPADPGAAWLEVEQLLPKLFPPREWLTQPPKPEEVADFQKKLIETTHTIVARAREFLRRFPTNENAGDAQFTVVFALSHAVAAGEISAEKEIREFVDATMADPAVPEDGKAKIFMLAGGLSVMKSAGMRFFVEGEQKFRPEMERAMVESLLAAREKFPTNEFLYAGLIGVAERSPAAEKKRLAEEVLNSPGASPGAKAFAQHLKDGTLPYQVGKPLDIKFTALDGREVDLAKMNGKVVLIEFWSTSCGPCVAEMPQLKAAYDKFHTNGFEIVAISLDDKESALKKFIQEKDLPWPQYFDGKGWANQFAVKYGIFGIPTVWLVDKNGNLADPNARGHVEQSIEFLLRK